jgi:site-specific DNA-cytosine methylase
MINSPLASGSLPHKVKLYWGTICSGGEGIVFSLRAIEESFQEMGVDLELIHVFSCEKKPSVQDFILGLLKELGCEGGCLFEHAEEMGQKKARCVRHNQYCVIRRSDIMIAGTSCKDFSRASSSYSNQASILGMATSVGGSAQTFRGLILYLANHTVIILLFENVDSMDDHAGTAAETTAVDTCVTEFTEVGFQVHVMLTDAQVFALPEERRRYYILGVRDRQPISFGEVSGKVILSRIGDLVAMCARHPPCLSAIIYDSENPHVEAELNRRTAVGTRLGEYNVATSINAFQALGLRWGATENIPDSLTESPWFSTLPPGQKSALVFSKAEQPKKVLMRDISQSLTRIRYSRLKQNYNMHTNLESWDIQVLIFLGLGGWCGVGRGGPHHLYPCK